MTVIWMIAYREDYSEKQKQKAKQGLEKHGVCPEKETIESCGPGGHGC
jgi:3-mercaptopyruvate sulfurtransferase SseA